MLYISLDDFLIKFLYVKKSLLGQYETAFYQKTLEIKILDNGHIANTDVIASALKEALVSLPPTIAKDKEVTLILPQGAFAFMRTDMPVDIGANVLNSYLTEKARSSLGLDPETSTFDYIIQENEGKKQLLFFALSQTDIENLEQPFKLVDLQLTSIIPESLAYFKLFEKTLRKDKKENIFYVSYNDKKLHGYVYDSFGLLEENKWSAELVKDATVEDTLKAKATECETAGYKLNRLILSGPSSETVRQDTFTKQVGVWTNPLKRIIPTFYQEYMKLLSTAPGQILPIAEYEECIGAFIFSLENKTFTLFSKRTKQKSNQPSPLATSVKNFPFKLVAISLGSFIATMGLLFLVSKVNFASMHFSMPSIPMLAKATPTPTPEPTEAPPTPTPTPAFDKTAVKIKLLNGTGTKGKASEIKALLKEKGYEEILTGNADNFDYTTSEIQLKKSKAELQKIIKEDLKDNVSDPTFTVLDEKSAADIVIIFGKDFK